MKANAILLAIIIINILTLSGCAKHSRVILAPDFKKEFAIDAALAVVIADTAPELIYFGDVKKSLRDAGCNEEDTTPGKLILSHFKAQLVKDIIKDIDIKTAFAAQPKHNFFVTKEVVKTAEEEIRVEIPATVHPIAFDSAAALALFLNHLRIGTETDPYYADRAKHGFYTTAPRKLLYLASFVLWDNRELKPLCYGRIRSSTPIVREEATPEDWEKVSRDFVRQIFEPAGFLKPK